MHLTKRLRAASDLQSTSFNSRHLVGRDGTAVASHTFTGVPLGTPHPNRVLVISYATFNTSSVASSAFFCTVGSTSAIRIAEASRPDSSTSSTMQSFYLHYPNETSVNITVGQTGTFFTYGLMLNSFISSRVVNPVNGSNCEFRLTNLTASQAYTASFVRTPLENSSVITNVFTVNTTVTSFSSNLNGLTPVDIRSTDFITSAYAQNLPSTSTTFSFSGANTSTSGTNPFYTTFIELI